MDVESGRSTQKDDETDVRKRKLETERLDEVDGGAGSRDKVRRIERNDQLLVTKMM